jgi:hypothetical protein
MKLKRRAIKYLFYLVSTDEAKKNHLIERKKEDVKDQSTPSQITEEYSRKTKYLVLLTTIYLL